MTEEQKQLLLKDLCARLPYGVKVYYKGTEFDLDNVKKDGRIHLGKHNDYKGEWWCSFDINDYPIPYLRSMSSMTEDEKKELCEVSTIVFQNALDEDAIGYNPKTFAYHSSLIDYCLSHHLDFRGLIDKGLALEAPADMYNN